MEYDQAYQLIQQLVLLNNGNPIVIPTLVGNSVIFVDIYNHIRIRKRQNNFFIIDENFWQA